MAYTLTFGEIADVRLQLGADVTADDLSDAQILSDSILGSAVDYVIGRLLEVIDPTKLDADDAEVVQNIRDGSVTALDTFVSDTLNGRQSAIFRRAVVFRVSGNCVPLIKFLSSESAGGIRQQKIIITPIEKQTLLYRQCDAELFFLRELSKTDALEDNVQKARDYAARLGAFGSTSPVSTGGTSSPGRATTSFNIDALAEAMLAVEDAIAFADADDGGVMRQASVSAIVALVAAQALLVNDFELSSPALDDFLPFTDTSQVGHPNRKATIADILALGVGLDIDTLSAVAPALSDTLAIADTSVEGAPNRKVTIQNILDLYRLDTIAAGAPTLEDLFVFVDASAQGRPNKKATIQDIVNLLSSFAVIDATAGTPSVDDQLVFADVSQTNSPNRKATISDILELAQTVAFIVDGLTLEDTPALEDTVAMADVSLEGNPNRKVTIQSIVDLVDVFSGNYDDLTGRPTIPTLRTAQQTYALIQSLLNYDDLQNKPTLFSGSYEDLTNKPTLFSGSYEDLTNKPTLFSGNYEDLTNKPTIPVSGGVFKSYHYVEIFAMTLNSSTNTVFSDGTNSAELTITPDSNASKFRVSLFALANMPSPSGSTFPNLVISFEYRIGSGSWQDARDVGNLIGVGVQWQVSVTDIILPATASSVTFRVLVRNQATALGDIRLTDGVFEVWEF